jgi:DNA-directed RNA polymerase subunit K/omega
MAARPVPHPLLNDGANVTTLGSRFLLSAIAFLRSKQLIGGSTARVEHNGHKPTYIAVLEVVADRISWTRE